MDIMKVVEKLQISALYFHTFEKTDCTIFTLLVGPSLYNRLEQRKQRAEIRFKICTVYLV